MFRVPILTKMNRLVSPITSKMKMAANIIAIEMANSVAGRPKTFSIDLYDFPVLHLDYAVSPAPNIVRVSNDDKSLIVFSIQLNQKIHD